MQQITCPFILNGIHFFWENLRVCSSNAQGPILLDNYKGENIDWEKLLHKRIEFRQKFINGNIPKCCENCFELENFKSNQTVNTSTYIDKMYISHWFHCNCSCIYCVHKFFTHGEFDKTVKKSKHYNLLPIIKSMVNEKILAPSAEIIVTGGEPTVLKEFDEILELLTNYVEKPITVLTSGIRYDEGIAQALKKEKCYIIISIDSGTKETYEQIKRVPCFNDVKENIKKYVATHPLAGNWITLKYILIKNLNDNVEEIEKWLLLAKELNIKSVRLDVEYSNSSLDDIKNIPEHYYQIYKHVKKRTNELNLTLNSAEQVNKILEKGHVF